MLIKLKLLLKIIAVLTSNGKQKMASEVVDIRERIERVRAEMAGEVITEEHG